MDFHPFVSWCLEQSCRPRRMSTMFQIKSCQSEHRLASEARARNCRPTCWSTGFRQVDNDRVKHGNLQVFQLWQVSEGPFLNNPQTVDALQRTAGNKEWGGKSLSNYNIAVDELSTDKHRRSPFTRQPLRKSQGLNKPLCNWEANPVQFKWNVY